MKSRELYSVKAMVNLLQNVQCHTSVNSHRCVIGAAVDFIKEQEEEINKLQALVADSYINAQLPMPAPEEFKVEKQEKKIIENNVIQKFVEKLKTEHSTPDIFMPFNWISCEEMVLDEIAKELVGADND